MNKWVMVRSEERDIYTHSRNLTVQIYAKSFDVDLGTSDLNRKQCSRRQSTGLARISSELPAVAGTSDRHGEPSD